MNKIYRVASASLVGVLLLLTLGSCSKESQLTPEAQPEAGAGQLAFSLDNDALRSVPAEDFEKAVDPNSVWCVFLTSAGSGAQTVQTAKPAYKTPAGNYSVNAGFVGAAQMFVIGNVESDLQSKLNNLTSGTTLEQVQKWIVKNSLGNGSADPAKFVMTSDLVNVTLPAVGAAPTNLSTPIVLKRLAARFDVINEVPELELTTVTVANRILSSTLFNVSQTGTEVAATTDYTVDGGKQLLHKIYSYQNTNKGGTTGATSFTLKGTYGGKAIKDIQVDLKNVADGQPLDVQRNYCYRIILKPTGDDGKPINPDPSHPTEPTTAWKVTIKVIDWNEAATDLANYTDEELAALGTDLSNTVNPTGKNLLNAVAEYNIDITGTKFTTSQTNEAGNTGYFTWAEAKALKMPDGYHLPTRYEWTAILGSGYYASNSNSPTYVYFNQNKTEKDVSLTVQIPGQTETMACLQDFKSVAVESATYMIRYKDNDTYRSAWRYSYVDSPIAGEGKILKIEAVPVKATLTIEQLNKAYFANPRVSPYVKTIYLPTTGFGYNKDGSGDGEYRGSAGDYWSATKYYGPNIYYATFDSEHMISYTAPKSLSASVRPFRDKI